MSLLHCQPCGKHFTGPVCYNQHMESDKHKRKVLSVSILNNSSGPREESAFTISSTSLSSNAPECPVCNLRFNTLVDFQTHSFSQEHAQKVLEKSANSLSSDIVSTSISSSNYEECNSDKNKDCDETDMILPAVETCRSSFSYCNSCNKSFSGPEPYKQHIVSAAHIKKVQLEKNISASKTNQTISEFSCDPCKKIFSGQAPYIQHMESEIHRKKIQGLQYIEKYVADSEINKFKVEENPLKKNQDMFLYCKVCDIPCCGIISYAQHLEGTAHLKKVLKAQRENGSLSVGASIQHGELCCSSQQLNSHMEGNTLIPGLMDKLKDIHISPLEESVAMFSPEDEINFDKTNNEINSNLGDQVIPNISNQNQIEINEKSKIKQECKDILMEKIEEKYNAYQICKVCDIILFNKDEAIIHYESQEHFKKRWE